MKLLITGTSNLIPNNQAWRKLGGNHEVVFGELNEWSDLFLREDSRLQEFEAVVWLVPLEDIVDFNSQDFQGGFREALSPVLAPLRAALARLPHLKFIVAWSSPLVPSPILYARRPALPWDAVTQEFENLLRELQTSEESLYLLPLNRIFGALGWNACFDARNFYAANCRFSFRGLQVAAENLGTLLPRFTESAKKVLVLDCDNTLWGGVIGEDGLEGIVLGQDGAGRAFQDFQRAAKRLAADGVLLALASKNSEADVWQVFEKHPGMVLKRNDIIAAAIDWNDKSAGLGRMAEELGLGLESFVFWDDNPLEREMIRQACPQVTVPEVSRDVSEWGSSLASLPAFHRFAVTAEDQKKLAQYQARGKFQSEQRTATDANQFLHSLNLRARAVPLDAALMGRAEQLCAKTNQFNLRTQRHLAADLKALSDEARTVLFLAHLQDRFGDHGNVGLVIARMDADGQTAFLDTFLLSCRVLGRHLEAWMLAHCIAQLRERGCKRLLGEFLATERNAPAKNFLGAHGFLEVAEAERDAARRVFPEIQKGSALYSVDLEAVKVPHSEIYESKN